MHKCFLFLVVCFLFSCEKDKPAVEDTVSRFKGELEWVKNFGGTGEETAQAVIRTVGGGYAVLGFTNSINGDITDKDLEVNDYWLLKFDANGTLEWNKTYGGSKDDRGQSLVQTIDGGYALTGYAMSADGDGSVNNGFHDNWIVKLNASGDIEWEKSYGFSGHDHSYDILETEDGELYFTGFLDITSARADGNTEKVNNATRHGVGEFWGTKISENGNLQWRGYFGGTNNDRAHAVVQSNDGGFVMAGFTESNDFDVTESNGSYEFWLVKVDALGNLVWQNAFGGTGIEIAHDIAKTKDGGYVVVGNTFSVDGDVSHNKGNSDVWMIKVDANGNLVWEQTYGGADFDLAQAVIEAKDGGFLIVGNSKSEDVDATFNGGENDIWVLKTTEGGGLIWQESFGGSGLDFGFDILENLDGSLMVVGETASNDFPSLQTKGKSDLVVLKIK